MRAWDAVTTQSAQKYESLRDPLALALDHEFATVRQFAGEAGQAATTIGMCKIWRVHKFIDALHPDDELRSGLTQAGAQKIAVRETADVGDTVSWMYTSPISWEDSLSNRCCRQPNS